MAIKKTLLEIVQEILRDMNSEDVNTISDSDEAEQIASIIESVYYNIVSTREIPEHEQLIKLTALSDSNTPTHFKYPDNVANINTVWYDVSATGDDPEYRVIDWVDPVTFLSRTDRRNDSYTTVADVKAGTTLRITTNKQPDFYTSFDDEYIVMDSYLSTVDSTLQASKSRAHGRVIPVFDKNTDSYVPDLDNVMFPYLIAEAKSMAFDLFKGGTTSKVEQAARRQKSYVQNDQFKTKRENIRNDYGRR